MVPRRERDPRGPKPQHPAGRLRLFTPTHTTGITIIPVTPPGLPEGQLYRPAKAGPYPAVLLIHGGGWRSGGPWHMAPIGKALAKAGFLAFATAYRLSPDHQHPAQEADVREALRWLAAREDVDSDRLALWGYSAGAQLALKTAFTTHSPELRAVVAGGTPGDFTLFDSQSPILRQFLGGIPRRSTRTLGRRLAPEFCSRRRRAHLPLITVQRTGWCPPPCRAGA